MENTQEGERLSCCSAFGKFLGLYWRAIIVLTAPILFLPVVFANPQEERAYRCLYIILVMAVYWITEALPFGITALIPIGMFPCLGILPTGPTCMAYFKDPNVMFFGGLVMALAIEYCSLHKRIALKVISVIGCSQKKLSLGLMLVTMFVSMWISNTAAAAMMCPVVVAILEELETEGLGEMFTDKKLGEEKAEGADEPNPSKATMCYFMGIAYAATLGGCGSLVGTGTNLTFKGIFETRFPSAPGIDFPRWSIYNVPPMLAATLLTWLFLQIALMGLFIKKKVKPEANKDGLTSEQLAKEIIIKRYQELGRISVHESLVAFLFVLSIALYFCRQPGIFPGWAQLIAPNTPIKDATPAILVVIALFMIPAKWDCFQFCRRNPKYPQRPSGGLIVWSYVQAHMPWSLLFLLGSGFALADGLMKSGLSTILGNALGGLSSLPPLAILFVVILTIQIITEFTSNVAIANIVLPVLAEMAVVTKINPLYLMIPAAITCSYAFHLPVGTPPNAIVAGYGRIRTKHMGLIGIGPTIITLLLVWSVFPTYGSLIYKGLSEFPDWAKEANNETFF